MRTYSIKDLEQLSGIKAHTIRIWEQRYQLLEPKRTPTNIRYYDDEDLKHLLNVSLLVQQGKKVSKVAQLSHQEVASEVRSMESESSTIEGQYTSKINGLILAMLELDELKFNHVFNTTVREIGFENTILQVVYPFLNKVGMMWSISEAYPAQEHFASNLIRQKLFVAIDEIMPAKNDAQKFLLFLPRGEDHEIALLFAYYLVKHHHLQAIYLGPNVPYSDIKEVVELTQPDFLMTFFITTTYNIKLDQYGQQLTRDFPDQQILISGNEQLLNAIKEGKQLKKFTGIPAFKEFLASV